MGYSLGAWKWNIPVTLLGLESLKKQVICSRSASESGTRAQQVNAPHLIYHGELHSKE